MSEAEMLQAIAQAERAAAVDTVARLLPAESRVSVYLFQPLGAAGLRPESPGVLWDIGPLPGAHAGVSRDLLYQCAEAGRTGSFLQSAAECTRRMPQTTRINRQAFDSYRSFNSVGAARRAQIAVEQARHGFQSKAPDGPPEGYFIHHLALSPGVQSFHTISTGRLPVLGIVFTVSRADAPVDRHEYTNLVDYALLLAGETLEIRAEQLLGRSHLTPGFSGSALEALLDDPASDAAVQLAVKLLFAHHWFFPYDPAAYHLLAHGAGGDVTSLYERHGWLPPRRVTEDARDSAELRALVVSDLATLVGHLCWYRLGREFRPRPGAVAESVSSALATALLLLTGCPTELPSYGGRASRGGKRERTIFLGPANGIAAAARGERFLAPAFGINGIQQIMRQRAAPINRFDTSFAVCGPGSTEGHTRTHFKPAQFVEGFDYGGSPRLSPRLHEGMRDRTRWLCSYAIGRIAELALAARGRVST
ncbi:MAG TPA: hypothetical protein VHW65_07810 [Gemmatimonadales bacterium]|jgi:hypothetical protein|nr:hypothetical protein [Gemmatimonadales bacterium]